MMKGMDALPSAELTMLFTDIEGSTRLLNRLGPRTPTSSPATAASCGGPSSRAGGREMSTEGDSFFVVFGSAADARARRGRQGQRALETHPWPGAVQRTGADGPAHRRPEPFEDNLVGLDVHRAARSPAPAHGGQVVLTQHDGRPGSRPSAARDVAGRPGVHRLKDIAEPQRLYQLVVPGLPAAVPAAAQSRRPGQPAGRPTPLVGRDAERAGCRDLLSPDGTAARDADRPGRHRQDPAGRRRRRMRWRRPTADGVHFVELATAHGARRRVDDDRRDARPRRRRRRQRAARAPARAGSVLLVLDNLEQLPGAGDRRGPAARRDPTG